MLSLRVELKQAQGTILRAYTNLNFHDIRITMTEPSRDPILPEEHGTEALQEETRVDSSKEQLSLQNQSLIHIETSLK